MVLVGLEVQDVPLHAIVTNCWTIVTFSIKKKSCHSDLGFFVGEKICFLTRYSCKGVLACQGLRYIKIIHL